MIMLDDQTAVVYNTNDLRDAVDSDNGIDHVFLGANIVLAYGIRIFSNKESLVIDGFYDGVTHTFTEMDSDSQGNTLYISGASSIQITMQNMIIIGRNWYGSVSIYENTGTRNLSITYSKVVYAGRQMTFNRNGLTRYIDCDITIAPTTKTSQEVGEVCKVEIGGTTVINHTTTSDSTFWFPTSSTEKYLTILADANVTITTRNDLMYTDSTSVVYTIESGASFTLNANNGFSRGSSHRAASFLVEKDASFRFIQTTNNGTSASLYIEGNLTVRQGANYYMQADYTAAAPLIGFMTTSSSLTVENPKSFVLYKRNTPALSFQYTRPFSLSGGQLNYWSTAKTPLANAGTFDDIPQKKWYRPNWSSFSVSGTVAANATSVTNSTFTPEELANLPALTDLWLHYARVLSIGDLPLTVNPVTDRRPITGTTAPYANVKAEYMSGGTAFSLIVLAEADGRYLIQTTVPVPFAAQVIVSANVPFLITMATVTSQEEGELLIENAPTLIRFILPPISRNPLWLRRASNEPVRVVDSRVVSTPWQLLASVDRPMTTQSGHTLPNAVVFVDENGEMTPLRIDDPIPVFEGGPDEPATDILWDDSKGILLHVTEPLHNKEEYTASLTWAVHPIE